jgi:ribosomal protein S18 acetylase RimI-like enzyme
MSGTVVDPNARRRGIGGMLLGDVLRRIGAAPVVVHVAESNSSALRLFTKYGFARTGSRWRDGALTMLALLRPRRNDDALAATPPFA